MAIVLEEFTRSLPPSKGTPDEISAWAQKEFELLERVINTQAEMILDLKQRIETLEGV